MDAAKGAVLAGARRRVTSPSERRGRPPVRPIMSTPDDETEMPDVVHWSPRQGPFAGPMLRLPHLSAGSAAALGLVAVGALTIGALAIGALAIGRLAVGSARLGDVKIGRLEVDDLVVRRRHGRPF